MRLAILSDIHGNLPALEAVLADARRHADSLVCAGDLAWGGPCPAEVIARLRELGCPCVLGNTDRTLVEGSPAHPYLRWALARLGPQELDFLAGLALEWWCQPPGEEEARLVVVHSAPGDPARPLPDPSQQAGLERLFGGLPAAVVVHGHDHRPSLVRLTRMLVVGTGSVGQPFDGDPRACYVLASWDAKGRAWRVTHRRVAYDIEESVRLALASEMPGASRWAAALRRGVPQDQVTL